MKLHVLVEQFINPLLSQHGPSPNQSGLAPWTAVVTISWKAGLFLQTQQGISYRISADPEDFRGVISDFVRII